MKRIRKNYISLGVGVALLVTSVTPVMADFKSTGAGFFGASKSFFSELSQSAGRTAAVGIGIAAALAVCGGAAYGLYRLNSFLKSKPVKLPETSSTNSAVGNNVVQSLEVVPEQGTRPIERVVPLSDVRSDQPVEDSTNSLLNVVRIVSAPAMPEMVNSVAETAKHVAQITSDVRAMQQGDDKLVKSRRPSAGSNAGDPLAPQSKVGGASSFIATLYNADAEIEDEVSRILINSIISDEDKDDMKSLMKKKDALEKARDLLSQKELRLIDLLAKTADLKDANSYGKGFISKAYVYFSGDVYDPKINCYKRLIGRCQQRSMLIQNKYISQIDYFIHRLQARAVLTAAVADRESQSPLDLQLLARISDVPRERRSWLSRVTCCCGRKEAAE